MYKVISRILIRGRTSEVLKYSVIQRNIITAEDRSDKPNKMVNLKKYWFNKYMNCMKSYERILEQRFPRTMQKYHVLSVGTKDIYMDIKRMPSLIKKQGLNGTDSLTREELQFMYTLPKDLRKFLPLFFLSAIPFANYIIFPLIFYFPRHLLTSHYWTLQQKLEFMLFDVKRKLKHNKPLFKCMQAELETIKDETLKIKWQNAMACLDNGTHPSVKDIIACCELFSGIPYSLNVLKRKHLVSSLLHPLILSFFENSL